jgi:hypothetical protein
MSAERREQARCNEHKLVPVILVSQFPWYTVVLPDVVRYGLHCMSIFTIGHLSQQQR